MRRTFIALALLGAAPLGTAPLRAQQAAAQGATASTQAQVHADTKLPAGWQMRIDPGRRIAPVSMTTMGDGFHINTGPGSGIFWKPGQTATGNYEIRASLSQAGAQAGHAEAYGIVFAGTNLAAENQAYFYFVIRGTGEYMVRHRAGNEVHTLADWTAHPAIRKVDATGGSTNELMVRVGADSVRFLVNGQQVQAYGRNQMGAVNGEVGLRANHRTELHLTRFEVVPARP